MGAKWSRYHNALTVTVKVPGAMLRLGGAAAMVLAVFGAAALYRRARAGRTNHAFEYARLKSLLHGEPLPAMVVDMDALDRNAARFADIARTHGKSIRLATKSVRVPALIFHVLATHADIFSGLMCFSVPEARFLARIAPEQLGPEAHAALVARRGLSYLVAYPTVQESDLAAAWEMTQAGHVLYLMVDSVHHVTVLDAFFAARARADAAFVPAAGAAPPAAPLRVRVCIDADMSMRPFEGRLGIHLGAHRSPCRTLADVRAVTRAVGRSRHLALRGVMGYEAQITGVPDANPFMPFLSPIVAMLKPISMADVLAKRRAIARLMQSERVDLEVFNGGGSGECARCCRDPSLTEVAVGSGLLQSTIFDYFGANGSEPAFTYALQVTRRCPVDSKNGDGGGVRAHASAGAAGGSAAAAGAGAGAGAAGDGGRGGDEDGDGSGDGSELVQWGDGVVVCQGGGFMASGEVSGDKCPQPFLPSGLACFSAEGFGEVQTPLRILGGDDARGLRPGDPVFMRPAKAGEVAERFNEYVLTRSQASIVGRARTYRGHGQAFH